MKKILGKIFRKIFRKKFLKDYDKYCRTKIGRALVYYKTDPLVFKQIAKDYSHTNNWEIFEITKILNKLGFVVDIIDRTINIDDLKLKDRYDIFIGAGSGDSGKYYVNICDMVPSAIKIFYALGLESNLSNQYMNRRYEYFKERHPNTNMQKRRIRSNIHIEEIMERTDFIFCVGNEFTQNSFKKFNKYIYQILLSSSPKLSSDVNQIINRNQKKFFYFGGNGNIVKGLDLTIEAFVNLPQFELYIGAPKTEEDFNKIYKPILSKVKNIHFIGFIDVDSNIYNKITSECGYVILPSSSEGCATSVTTCMRRGLIPVVTKETGVDIGNFGYHIDDIKVDKLTELIKKIANSDREEFIKKSFDTYIESFKYTQANFSFTFKNALLDILKDTNYLNNHGK